MLTRVAGPMLESLVASVQRDETGNSRGRVQPLSQDPLAVLARGANRSTGAADIGWDEFILGSLGDRRDPMTPLSSTVLTDIEVGERHHERVQSYVVLPARLASRFSYAADAPVEVVPVTDTAASVDLAWRVDIAGPVPIGAIHLWSGSGQAAFERASDDVGTWVEDSGI